MNQCFLIFNWTIRPNFSEIWIKIQKIQENAFENVVCRPFCTGLNRPLSMHHLQQTSCRFYVISNLLCVFIVINTPGFLPRKIDSCERKKHAQLQHSSAVTSILIYIDPLLNFLKVAFDITVEWCCNNYRSMQNFMAIVNYNFGWEQNKIATG